jgi:hypothetical protein
MFFGDVPGPAMLAGGLVIVLAGLLLLVAERKAGPAPRAAALDGPGGEG